MSWLTHLFAIVQFFTLLSVKFRSEEMPKAPPDYAKSNYANII